MKLVKLMRFGFLSLLWLVQTMVYSQSLRTEIRPANAPGYDSGYVVSFRDNFVFTVVNETKSSSINASFKTKYGDYTLDYKTNIINTWGIGIDYKWLTFEYTHKMPWYTPDPEKGEVENIGVGFGITGKKLAFKNFLEVSKGYYLENTDDWLKDYVSSTGSYYLRPDIETFTYYSSLNYVFNHKRFSNNASLWQLDRQQKRAGTFVSGLSYIFNSFHSDSSIIPTTGIDTFPRSNNTYFALHSIGLNFGYMVTFPLGRNKKWFITTALIPGISRQWGKVTIEDLGVVQANKLLGFQSEFRLGFGYNGDKWYVGSVAKTYSNLNAVEENYPMSISHVYGRFYVGYRFRPFQINNPLLKKLGL